MFCPNCGGGVPEGSIFCPHCGFRLTLGEKQSTEEVIRTTLIRRIEGIKNRDADAVGTVVYKERYTKFDDWPPFELQGSEGLENEAKALKVLKEYEYETRTWRIDVFGDSAIAAFTIRYRGKIRDKPFSVQSRVTAFLAKQDGQWKIVHEHWSSFPQQEPQKNAFQRKTHG